MATDETPIASTNVSVGINSDLRQDSEISPPINIQLIHTRILFFQKIFMVAGLMLCASSHAATSALQITPINLQTAPLLTTSVINLPPTISGYTPAGCFKTGSSMTLSGSNFGTQKALALGGAGANLPVTVSSWSSNQIVALIPNNPALTSGHAYFIGIVDSKTGGWLSNTDKTFSICAVAVVLPTLNQNISVIATLPLATAPITSINPPPAPVTPTAPSAPAVPATPSTGGDSHYDDYYGSSDDNSAWSDYGNYAEPPTPSVLPNSAGSLMDRALPPPPPNLAAIQKQQKFLREFTEPEELVVISADMQQAQQLAQILAPYGLTPKRRKPLKNLGLVISAFRVPAETDLQQITLQVRDANPQMWVDLNHRYQLLGDDSRAAKNQIAWPMQDAHCGQGLRIGMIDTDLNLEHPSLKNQTIVNQSMVSSGIKRPAMDHGTAVASLLIGQRDSVVAGLLPQARLYNAAVFRARDNQHADTTAEWLINAIDWLLEQKVHIINMSLGGPRNLLLDVAIQRSIQSGVMVVAAAGHGGANATPVYPAAQPGVIAVTAVDNRHKIWRDAAHGDYLSFAAPGVDIFAANAQSSGGKYVSGTSFATAFVTAAMASQLKKNNPRDAYTLLEKSARDLGKPGKDPQFGWGLIQAQCQ